MMNYLLKLVLDGWRLIMRKFDILFLLSLTLLLFAAILGYLVMAGMIK